MPMFRNLADDDPNAPLIEMRQFNPEVDFLGSMAVLEWAGAEDGPDGGVFIPPSGYVAPRDWIGRYPSGTFIVVKPDVHQVAFAQIP